MCCSLYPVNDSFTVDFGPYVHSNGKLHKSTKNQKGPSFCKN